MSTTRPELQSSQEFGFLTDEADGRTCSSPYNGFHFPSESLHFCHATPYALLMRTVTRPGKVEQCVLPRGELKGLEQLASVLFLLQVYGATC